MRGRRRLLKFGGPIVFGFVLVTVYILLESYRAFEEGEEHLSRGDEHGAIIRYERAIRYYLPFHPKGSQSRERLWEIAKGAWERGDDWLSIDALRSLRGSLYATQHFLPHDSSWFPRVEGILSLRDGDSLRSGSLFPSDPFWSCMALLGFFGWSGGIVAWIVEAFWKKRRKRSIVIALGAVIVLGYGVWILGLTNA